MSFDLCIKADHFNVSFRSLFDYLVYTAEINDKLLNFDQMRDRKQKSVIDAVLNFDQMRDRKQKSVIDAVLNLVHNA